MKALTIRQPHAWAIIHGGKDVENRGRNLVGDYRGRIAIHAGLHPFEQHNMASRAHRAVHDTEVDTTLAFGAIIGTANLWAVHRATPGNLCCPRGNAGWGQPDQWHLCLTDPQPLAKPIPATGHLWFWDVPEDLLEELTRHG